MASEALKHLKDLLREEIENRISVNQALLHEQEKNLALLTATPGLLFWIGRDREYLGANVNYCNLISANFENIDCNKFGEGLEPEELKVFVNNFLEEKIISETLEISILNDDKEEIFQFIAHRFDAGRSHVFVAMNITDKVIHEKKLEKINEELDEMVKIKTKDLEIQSAKAYQSARLASLGEMAGGIAHEINNPLAIISMSSSRLRKASDKGKLTEKLLNDSLESIDSTISRISKIISGLRNISRSPDSSLEGPVIIREMLEDVLGLCSEKFRSAGINLTTNLDASLEDFSLTGNRVQLSQVFVNLLSNAYDAIENLDDKWIKIEVSRTKGHIIIKVEDSGSGIEKKIQDKMFDPLFTSKDIGKGTGLGLSISRNLIQVHGGKIEIDNFSKNTCFIVKFPLSNK